MQPIGLRILVTCGAHNCRRLGLDGGARFGHIAPSVFGYPRDQVAMVNKTVNTFSIRVTPWPANASFMSEVPSMQGHRWSSVWWRAYACWLAVTVFVGRLFSRVPLCAPVSVGFLENRKRRLPGFEARSLANCCGP